MDLVAQNCRLHPLLRALQRSREGLEGLDLYGYECLEDSALWTI